MTDAAPLLRIGSRGSDLALWQARHVRSRLAQSAEIKIITTSGDRFLDASPGSAQLPKGLFTKEIEDELLAGAIDLAVHSLKDLPTTLAPGLALAAVGAREGVADLLLVHPEAHDETRPFPVRPGGRVGATSLRRQSMLRAFAPWCEPAPLRGNVPTRVIKARRGDYAAVVVARAGLKRLALDLSGLAVYELLPARWLPAPGQGALAIESREGDARVAAAVAPLEEADSRACTGIERTLLARFEGGCHAPFGAWATVEDGAVRVRVGHEDGAGRWQAVEVAAADAARAVAEAEKALRERLRSGAASPSATSDLCRRLETVAPLP